jgi:hypothetical protein
VTGEGLASETYNRCPAGTYRGHDARLHVSVSGSLTTIGETARPLWIQQSVNLG